MGQKKKRSNDSQTRRTRGKKAHGGKVLKKKGGSSKKKPKNNFAHKTGPRTELQSDGKGNVKICRWKLGPVELGGGFKWDNTVN